MTTCPHCGAKPPAHYGTCAMVPDDMKALFAELDRDRDRDQRRADEAARRAANRQSLTPPRLADLLEAYCTRGSYTANTSEVIAVANGMAFDILYDDGSMLTVTVTQKIEPK